MINADCMAWEGLAQGVKMAREMSAFPQMDEIERQIEQLAHDILADARRVEAMRRDCPQRLKEIEARVPQPSSAQLVNPLANLTALASDLRELSPDEFAAVEEVVSGERARREAKGPMSD
jgi:hypothetical protein